MEQGGKPCEGYVVSSGWPCDRQAQGVYLLGCVHEHVKPRSLCDWHLDDVRRGLHLCGDCLSGTTSHECRLLGNVA